MEILPQSDQKEGTEQGRMFFGANGEWAFISDQQGGIGQKETWRLSQQLPGFYDNLVLSQSKNTRTQLRNDEYLQASKVPFWSIQTNEDMNSNTDLYDPYDSLNILEV